MIKTFIIKKKKKDLGKKKLVDSIRERKKLFLLTDWKNVKCVVQTKQNILVQNVRLEHAVSYV